MLEEEGSQPDDRGITSCPQLSAGVNSATIVWSLEMRGDTKYEKDLDIGFVSLQRQEICRGMVSTTCTFYIQARLRRTVTESTVDSFLITNL